MIVGSAILVTYNSAPSIELCLAALRSQSEWERIVVDNASTDNSVERARAIDPQARVIANDRNLGFGAAANQGARIASGDILLFLNPDAIPQPGALMEFLAALKPLDVVAAGGLLLCADRQPDRGFSVRGFPTTVAMAAEILLLNRLWPGNPVNRRYRCLDLDYSKAQDVDQPAGACLAVRRDAWESVGGFDEAFFPVWFEDVDLCLRLRRRGWRIVYWPKARFVHSGGHSVNRLAIADRQLIWYRNMLRYFRKHKGPFSVACLRICIAAGMGIRALAASIGSVPQNTSRAQALHAYAQVVRQCVLSVGPSAETRR
jgi:N-acetylglucosaminyl-diphospho-decaprenol L-rhamnosyltransferase